MKNVELKQPYTLQQLIKYMTGSTNVEDEFCLYTEDYDPVATPVLVCYLAEHPQVDENDKEIYPDFVYKENLSLFLYGEHLADIIRNAKNQKSDISISEIVNGINYYIENDNFITIE